MASTWHFLWFELAFHSLTEKNLTTNLGTSKCQNERCMRAIYDWFHPNMQYFFLSDYCISWSSPRANKRNFLHVPCHPSARPHHLLRPPNHQSQRPANYRPPQRFRWNLSGEMMTKSWSNCSLASHHLEILLSQGLCCDSKVILIQRWGLKCRISRNLDIGCF